MRAFLTTAVIVVAMFAGIFTITRSVHAIDVFQPCTGAGTTAVCKAAGTDRLFGAGGTWNKVLNLLTFLIGAISVIMVIVGGLRYTLSAGDSSSITAAKNTIIYALVGLVLATLGNAIVNFVLTNI